MKITAARVIVCCPGRNFVTLKIETDERSFARHDLTGFEVVMDNTHGKITRHIKGLPVIQVSHDREARPSAQAVFPTQAHALYHGFNRTNARIVYNGVDVQDVQADSNGYFAYLSTFHTAKGARGAMQAAELAGVKLVMAGGSPPAPPPGSNYIGPLAGEDKLKFLAGATALLFPSAIEAGPVTVLEAESVGCPVIVSRFGWPCPRAQARDYWGRIWPVTGAPLVLIFSLSRPAPRQICG